MPHTHHLQLLIDRQEVELGDINNLGLLITYALELTESFEQKQAARVFNLQIPATPANAEIFNALYDPSVQDTTPTGQYSGLRSCTILVQGVTIFQGKAMVTSSNSGRMPGSYELELYGGNGDWVINAEDLTLWDTLNETTHLFNVTTIENSWVAFDADEFSDYVYAPVRYRSPFGDNDDAVNIYHLRPSISLYWLLMRGFRQLGYRVNSQFFETPDYFRRLVLPWVWGDFYDINSEITNSIRFKACGPDTPFPVGTHDFWAGDLTDPNNTSWQSANAGLPTHGTYYVRSVTNGLQWCNFKLDENIPPKGYDNFSLYSFDESTGTMKYDFTLPNELNAFFGANITGRFQLSLIGIALVSGGGEVKLEIEITHDYANGDPTTVSYELFTELSSNTSGIFGNHFSPTVHNFYVNNISPGDVLKFRLRLTCSLVTDAFTVHSGCKINTNPSAGLVPGWYYDKDKQRWENTNMGGSEPYYQQQTSSFEMMGLQIELGNQVHFKWYDKFRNYKWLDLLRGVVDTFNLSIQTDPLEKVVTIEPTHDYLLPDGTAMPGYYSSNRQDWTDKRDVSKEAPVLLFSDSERVLDFLFKQDGADGGQNITAARFKNVNLSALTTSKVSSGIVDNGIIAGVPGASRYVLPARYRKGKRQQVNRFFSATMHYRHEAWKKITGTAPQLVAIIPENVSDSSSGSVSQTFEPKIAFYKGYCDRLLYGGWRWRGDPSEGGINIPTYNDADSVLFDLPFMFAVNYGYRGQYDPILTYSDQLINGAVCTGLMKDYFLKRLAIMRNGKLYRPSIRLDLGDITDWTHRNKIIIGNNAYNLVEINNYNPLKDDSAECAMWQDAPPMAEDIANCYPSYISVEGATPVLTQFDLKYVKLLLYPSDLPQF